MRWAWPPLNPVPPWPMTVSKPRGKLVMKSAMPAAEAAAVMLGVVARREGSGRA